MAPDAPRPPNQLLVDLPPDSDVAALARQLEGVGGVLRIDAPVVDEALVRDLVPADQDAVRKALLGRPATDRRLLTVTLEHQADVELAPLLPGARITGLPLLQAAHARAAHDEQLRLGAVLVPGLFLALWALLRRWDDAVLVLGSVGVGALGFAGFLGWMGVSIGGPNLLLLPLVIVLGLADAVHLTHRAGHLHLQGEPDAPLHALRDVAGSCAITSFTTAVAFGALVLSPSPAARQFGALAALGVGVSLAAGLILPAAVLTLRRPHSAPLTTHPPTARIPDVRWLAVVLLLVAVPASLATHLDLGVERPVPVDDPALVTLTTIDDALGGVHAMRWVLETGVPDGIDELPALRGMLRVHHTLQASPQVGAVFSYADALTWIAHSQGRPPEALLTDRRGHPFGNRPLRRVQQAIAERLDRVPVPLVDADRSAFIVHARLHDRGAADWSGLQADLDHSARAFASVEAEGYPALLVAAYRTLPMEIVRVVTGSALGVLVVVGLRTRSVAATLGGVALLVAVTLCTLAALVLLGKPLSQTNLFVLSLAIGLGLDGWIHLVTNQSSTVYGGVGRSTLLSAVGFLLLGLSPLPTVRGIGFTLVLATLCTWVLTVALHRTLRSRLGGAHAVP